MSKVLVVDDSDVDRKLLSKVLLKSNFSVAIAKSGPQCLEQIKSQCPDLILTDIQMPEMSGTDLLVEIRKLHGPLELPIIMVSGLHETKDIVNCLALGANDYISKPYVREIVISRVQIQLDLAEAARKTALLGELNVMRGMVATLNHEINNPLAIALGWLETGEAVDKQKVRAALKRIDEIVKKITEISKSKPEYETYVGKSKMLKITG